MHWFRKMASRSLSGIASLLFPRICILCRQGLDDDAADGSCVCPSCWQKIKKNPSPMHGNFGEQHDAFDQALSPALYEGALKELIRHFKYHKKQHLGQQLSSLIIEGIHCHAPGFRHADAVVPMPLHPVRHREREFNQASVLGAYIAGSLRLPLLEKALVRTRYTAPQAELDAIARFANIQGCFSVPDKALINGKTVLLVDDVLTTGATAREASRCLKEAGAAKVYVATLAQ